jgi:hypothetical protein
VGIAEQLCERRARAIRPHQSYPQGQTRKERKMVNLKQDNFKMGLLIGLLMPVISFVGYYFWKFRLFSFGDFLQALRNNKPLVTALTIPCLVLNIALFTLYINTRRDKTAKGVFVVTLIYAIVALLFKFFA